VGSWGGGSLLPTRLTSQAPPSCRGHPFFSSSPRRTEHMWFTSAQRIAAVRSMIAAMELDSPVKTHVRLSRASGGVPGVSEMQPHHGPPPLTSSPSSLNCHTLTLCSPRPSVLTGSQWLGELQGYQREDFKGIFR
jgi:hypothetical protein